MRTTIAGQGAQTDPGDQVGSIENQKSSSKIAQIDQECIVLGTKTPRSKDEHCGQQFKDLENNSTSDRSNICE